MPWFVKDFADGWIRFSTEAEARAEAERTGAAIWDRKCHVCWYNAYALWIEEPQSDCPFGHKAAHECREFAMPSAQTAATVIKLKAAGLISSPQKD